jgi:hypothetical protein
MEELIDVSGRRSDLAWWDVSRQREFPGSEPTATDFQVYHAVNTQTGVVTMYGLK